ncbi:MAG: valine--tRNA ligase [Chitinophagales bacterium]|jgi:valyl-tRNA synthetase|nr:valine--tRNA ligase [Sphingobacteriales bacterium]MBP9141299.1 valine--tRNA ligase [Chitinophagales bacterium]MDA0199400.1 valine--tRNA ligase [Bacteroidota bacterium]MBK6889382.1 valine--tRNA ligase [Sphingobacteriales bacterium]MBL0246152.1 valine--tRNA ligase [Sphingobacteriales bacterium]
MELAKTYAPQSIETKWYDYWMEHKFFASKPDPARKPFTIVIPPPNVTGVLHMGHMLNNTIQDILIRRARMQGFNACWVPGSDHASIATEAKVVQKLRAEGIKKSDLSRETFLQHAWAWANKHSDHIYKQLRQMGASCDWDRNTFTMDEHYYKSVVNVFVDLYDKGHIYRALRMVNWDVKAQTAVSDEEVFYRETTDELYYVKYFIEGSTTEYLTVATTRPETIMADTAVAVHPLDERYTHLHGKMAIVPLINKPVPIITDEYVDRKFGTGCLKVTPAHDKTDYEIGLRHNLPILDIIDFDGRLNQNAQFFIGFDSEEARPMAAVELEKQGLIVKREPLTHAKGYSERTDAVIEPKLSMQWFLSMKQICQPALDAVVNGEVQIIPDKFVATYRYWMENVKDWCLSRQLWWGQQIPAYFIKNPDEKPEKWQFVVAQNITQAVERARRLTNNPDITENNLQQDPDVLDTWASSWLWPIEVFKGYSNPNNEEINYYYPTNVLVTAPEILFFWVARMIIAGIEYRAEKPFSHVYLTGIVRDKLRRKMSKSLGNSPDTMEVIAQHGADGLRMGIMLSSPAGNDILYDEELVLQGRNFANKIWNALRLVKSWTTEGGATKNPDNEPLIAWFGSKLNQFIDQTEALYADFKLSEIIKSLYNFIWDDFCGTYLEMAKPEYGQPIDLYTYNATLQFFEDLMKLLHPFMPFITEEVYHTLCRRANPADCIVVARYPQAQTIDNAALLAGEQVAELIRKLRDTRVKLQLKPRDLINLALKTVDASASGWIAWKQLLVRKAYLSEFELVNAEVPNSVSLLVGNDVFFITTSTGNLIDTEAERSRLQKELEYLEGFRDSVLKKLNNERFVQNAKSEVVALEQKKLEDAEQKITSLQEGLARLTN